MKRRFRMAMSLFLATVVLAGPVAAHDFTGSEERKNSRGRTVYTNDVRCARGERANAGGVRVYTTQSGTSGGVGTCNDGTGPLGSRLLQGRAVVTGSQNGVTTYADGDKHNSGQAQGWARVDATRSGVNIRCGDEKGRKDATHPTSADTREDCG